MKGIENGRSEGSICFIALLFEANAIHVNTSIHTGIENNFKTSYNVSVLKVNQPLHCLVCLVKQTEIMGNHCTTRSMLLLGNNLKAERKKAVMNRNKHDISKNK